MAAVSTEAPSALPAAAVATTGRPGQRSVGFVVRLVVLAVAVGVAGLYGNPYVLSVGSQVAIFAMVTLGLNVLVGYTGQISFGHNAFFGAGGYLSALATTSWGLPPLAAMLLGVGVSIVLAVIVGFPTLRLRGHFLAMATLGVGLGFYSFAVASPIFNGFTGIGGIPPFSVGSLEFDTSYEKFWLVGGVLLVAIVAAARLRERRYGRALRSVSSDEATAQSIGINVHRTKLSAFVVSAVFASIAGSLYAHTMSYVSPESFGFATILTFFMMLFIGGLGSVWGALLGAFVVTVVPEFVPASVQGWEPTLFSVLLIVVLIVRPAGLFAPRARDRRRARTRRTRPEPAA